MTVYSIDTMSAFASAFGRSSGGATSAVFEVGAMSASSWFHRPMEMNAFARDRAGSLYDPFRLKLNALLVGHIGTRPNAGPPVFEPPTASVARNGLSNSTTGMLLLYLDALNPTLNRPRVFANSSMLLKSVVRSSVGTPSSTDGLRPGEVPKPNDIRLCPLRFVFLTFTLKSMSRFKA